MIGKRASRRLGMGLLAGALAFAPLASASAQPDIPPMDEDEIFRSITFYSEELFGADFDGDGVPDITDSDGDGIPDIPVGDPGERDLLPGDGSFLEDIRIELENSSTEVVTVEDGGSELLGDCGGMAMSFDEEGKLVDLAIGIPSNEGGGVHGQLIDGYGENFGQRIFTSENPFLVADRVIYIGTLPREGEGAIEHNWSISTAGISLDSGGDPNPNGKNRNAGEVKLGNLPTFLRPAGIFPVTGELTSENGLFCEATGWIEFDNPNPLLTAQSAIAAIFGLTGALGLLFNSRPALTWKA